jgi:hypothetical protein
VCDGAAADREDAYDVAKRASVLNAACALDCVGAVFGHCAETGSSYGHDGVVAPRRN